MFVSLLFIFLLVFRLICIVWLRFVLCVYCLTNFCPIHFVCNLYMFYLMFKHVCHFRSFRRAPGAAARPRKKMKTARSAIAALSKRASAACLRTMHAYACIMHAYNACICICMHIVYACIIFMHAYACICMHMHAHYACTSWEADLLTVYVRRGRCFVAFYRESLIFEVLRRGKLHLFGTL